MKIVLLDAATLGDDIDMGAISRCGELVVYETTAPHETLEHIADAAIVITNKVVIDAPLMEKSPALQCICVAATGVDNVDVDFARARGISVKNVAGYATESVVQMTFSHLMYLLNSHSYYDEYARSRWQDGAIFTHHDRPFHEICNKRWGVVGLGTIGRRVAEVATAFGCRVSYYSTTGRNTTRDYERLELNQLLSTSHIVSIHAPLNEQTRHLIDYERLSLIRNDGIIINMGRGGIIREDDLARAIDERPLYAGVDVVEREPIEACSPLLSVKHTERLSMTPHIAWASVEARQRLVAALVANIEEFSADNKRESYHGSEA